MYRISEHFETLKLNTNQRYLNLTAKTDPPRIKFKCKNFQWVILVFFVAWHIFRQYIRILQLSEYCRLLISRFDSSSITNKFLSLLITTRRCIHYTTKYKCRGRVHTDLNEKIIKETSHTHKPFEAKKLAKLSGCIWTVYFLFSIRIFSLP